MWHVSQVISSCPPWSSRKICSVNWAGNQAAAVWHQSQCETELAGVDLRVLVAVGAVARRLGEGQARVAVSAFGALVGAVQGIDLAVLEPDHAVLPVVAAHAVIAVQLGVLRDILGRLLCVALGAGVRGGLVLPSRVAALAGERRAVIVSVVQVQEKAGKLFVVDAAKWYVADGGVAPLVFGVAGLALVGARQQAVQALGLGALPRDLAVAVLAEVGRETADRGVAVLALLFKVGVGAVPVDRLAVTLRGRDRAGHIARLEPIGSATQAQDQEGQQECDEYSGAE